MPIPERPYSITELLQRWLAEKLRPGIPFDPQTQRFHVPIIQPLTLLNLDVLGLHGSQSTMEWTSHGADRW